jgi:hypothetical protein
MVAVFFMLGVKVGDNVAVGVPFKPGKLQDDTITKERSVTNKKVIFVFIMHSYIVSHNLLNRKSDFPSPFPMESILNYETSDNLLDHLCFLPSK